MFFRRGGVKWRGLGWDGLNGGWWVIYLRRYGGTIGRAWKRVNQKYML
jgi:hypothetical protein